jgi:hypothetical protein
VAVILSLSALLMPSAAHGAGILASDGFQREVADGWGDLDVGGTWYVTNGNDTSFSVDNGVGHMEHTATGQFLSELKTRVPDFSAADVDITADFRAQVAPDSVGAVDQFALYSRYEGAPDYRYYLKLIVEFAVGQTVPTMRVDRQANTFTQGVANGAVVGPNDPTQWWTLRFQVIGDQVRAKAWLTGSPEPALWAIDYTDGSVVLPNQFGVSTYTNDVSPAAVFDVDNVQVVDAAPVSTPTPTPTTAPTATPAPTASTAPTATPAPTATTAPTATPAPTATTAPTVTPAPTDSQSATATPSATASPATTATPKASPTQEVAAATGTPGQGALPNTSVLASGRSVSLPALGFALLGLISLSLMFLIVRRSRHQLE